MSTNAITDRERRLMKAAFTEGWRIGTDFHLSAPEESLFDDWLDEGVDHNGNTVTEYLGGRYWHSLESLFQVLKDNMRSESIVQSGIRDNDATRAALHEIIETLSNGDFIEARIPEGISYSVNNDNFYRDSDGIGLGSTFYFNWRHLKSRFPKREMQS